MTRRVKKKCTAHKKKCRMVFHSPLFLILRTHFYSSGRSEKFKDGLAGGEKGNLEEEKVVVWIFFRASHF